VAHRLVEPALHLPEPVRLICREGRLTSLLAELAIHRLDMVIADRPMPANLNVRGYSHLLGESTLTVFGAAALIKTLNGAFPALLDGAPFLMPGDDVAIRPRLEQWFEAQRLHPRIVGEFDDSALLKAFGQAAAGLFVAPTRNRRLRLRTVSCRHRRTHRCHRRTALRDYHRATADPPSNRRHQRSGAQGGVW
jgi:LysR family transcriptional activator of nhaA